jgi:hypothetical protein
MATIEQLFERAIIEYSLENNQLTIENIEKFVLRFGQHLEKNTFKKTLESLFNDRIKLLSYHEELQKKKIDYKEQELQKKKIDYKEQELQKKQQHLQQLLVNWENYKKQLLLCKSQQNDNQLKELVSIWYNYMQQLIIWHNNNNDKELLKWQQQQLNIWYQQQLQDIKQQHLLLWHLGQYDEYILLWDKDEKDKQQLMLYDRLQKQLVLRYEQNKEQFIKLNQQWLLYQYQNQYQHSQIYKKQKKNNILNI